MTENPLTKPLLRGYSHQAAFYVALGACLVLIFESYGSSFFWPDIIYSFGVLSMFGFSALYHRPMWSPEKRHFMGRLDHSGIYLMIAGSFTPVAQILSPESTSNVLVLIWTIAGIGIFQSLFGKDMPKWVSALLYIGAGWMMVPYVPELNIALTKSQMVLIFLGGVLYTVGALAYALRRPILYPKYFGYHEVFHLLVVCAAVVHFIVIYQISKL